MYITYITFVLADTVNSRHTVHTVPYSTVQFSADARDAIALRVICGRQMSYSYSQDDYSNILDEVANLVLAGIPSPRVIRKSIREIHYESTKKGER